MGWPLAVSAGLMERSPRALVAALWPLTVGHLLAMLLMTGRTIKEAAAVLGITEGSARQYLSRIFRKTATNRQVDLIRVIGDALSRHG